MDSSVSPKLLNMAHSAMVRYAYAGYQNSPYLNIPYYQQRTDPSDSSQMVMDGPPAMTNEPGRSQRGDPKNLIRFQQGIRPLVDSLVNKSTVPVTVTVMNEEKTDEQGEPRNDSTTPKGRNQNRDTIGFNPGEWTPPNMDDAPSGWNDPYDNR